jgi:hypothetical protein
MDIYCDRCELQLYLPLQVLENNIQVKCLIFVADMLMRLEYEKKIGDSYYIICGEILRWSNG